MARYLFIFLALTSQSLGGVDEEALLIGHWEGHLTSQGNLWAIAADFRLQDGGIVGTGDATDLGMYAVPWRGIEVDGNNISLAMQVDKAEISMECHLHGDTLKGEYNDGRTRAEVFLTKRLKTPIVFRTEELMVEGENGLLAATVIYPDTPGPYATVVLAHGSGQFTRDIASYRGRAYMFARAGVAAVIYDRQGKGASTGDTSRILPIASLASDLLSIVREFRAHADIRAEKVGVYGLSQAGWVVPRAVASSDGVIAFAITVSAPGITPDSQDVIATGFIEERAITKELHAAGLAAELIGDVVAQHREARMEAMASSGSSYSEIETVIGFSHYDPIADWEKISIPVLGIWGQNDRLVPAQESYDLISSALQRAGNKNVVTVLFPDATHTLEVDRDATQRWDWNRLAPGFQDTLTQWIQGTVSNN